MDDRTPQYDPSDPQRYGPDYLPWQGYAPTALLERPLGAGWDDAAPVAEVPAAPSGPQRPSGRRRARWIVAAVAAAALVLAGIGVGYAAQDHPGAQPSVATQQDPGATDPGTGPGTGLDPTSPGGGSDNGGLPAVPRAPGTTTPDQQKSTASSPEGVAAAAAISPALVNITTTVSYGQGEAAGTGIVLTADGVVLTNHHVIEGATKIEAYDVGNGQSYTATVVGYDSTHDVAVLQLQGASDLQTATIDDDGVAVGDGVVGVGNAGGLGGTPSAAEGVVTALEQSITVQSESGGSGQRLSNLIETDAAIEPGDSGGALVDLEGEVVGVDTAASSANTTGRGTPQGYAVPIGQALTIAGEIQAGNASDTVHIGETAFLGVQLSGDSAGSVVVGGVVDGSAADELGIGAGDVITSVDGQRIRSAEALSAVIKGEQVGSSITLTWRDGTTGQGEQGTATLQSGPVG